MDHFNKDDKYYRAKKRVAQIKTFYMSLASYIIFIGFLATLNYYTNEWRNLWFLWAAFGWGIGLFFQAAKAFDFMSLLGKDWEAKKMKEFMEEEDKNKNDEPKIRF